MNQKPHESNHQDVDDARLTAYALGQLDAADSAEVERWLPEVGPSRAARRRQTSSRSAPCQPSWSKRPAATPARPPRRGSARPLKSA